MKANYQRNDKWVPLEEGTELATGATLYDMSCQVAAQAPPLGDEAIEECKEHLKKYITSHPAKYFMLLCNELRDYTIFNCEYVIQALQQFPADVVECLQNRGDFIGWEATEDDVATELWLKIGNGSAHAYYLFPYDEGVIEYGH